MSSYLKDDLSATCDSMGNCMIKTDPKPVVVPTNKHCGTLRLANGAKGAWDSNCNIMINLADNSLTCDSAGNCMLRDLLL